MFQNLTYFYWSSNFISDNRLFQLYLHILIFNIILIFGIPILYARAIFAILNFFIKLIDIAKVLPRRHQKLNLRTISQDILQKLLEYCITFLDDNVIYVD